MISVGSASADRLLTERVGEGITGPLKRTLRRRSLVKKRRDATRLSVARCVPVLQVSRCACEGATGLRRFRLRPADLGAVVELRVLGPGGIFVRELHLGRVGLGLGGGL